MTPVHRTTGGALSTLRARGFDESTQAPFARQYRVGCSQCAALAINGTPSHETGCPNAVQECRGCNALIPVSPWAKKYCEDCN